MKAIQFFFSVAIAIIVIYPYGLEAGEKDKGSKKFLGKVLLEKLHHPAPHSIRDLFVEDVPGTKSYWLGPWVEVVPVNGVIRFYKIKGYDRFYVNAAFLGDSKWQFLARSSENYDFYGPFEGKPSDHFDLPAERSTNDQSTTDPKLKSEDKEKPKPEPENGPQ